MTEVPTAIACCAPLAAPVLSDEEAEATADLFRALGDPARVRILNVLATTNEPRLRLLPDRPTPALAADRLPPPEEVG